MEKKLNDIAKKSVAELGDKKITRKDAIKKTGFIAASAATMMVLLNNPAQAGNRHKGYQCSPSGDNNWDDESHNRRNHHRNHEDHNDNSDWSKYQFGGGDSNHKSD